MSARGVELLEIMDGQIAGLTDLLRERGEVALKLPCPGRANMADGTVGAVVAHTADRYQQIAGFCTPPMTHPGTRCNPITTSGNARLVTPPMAPTPTASMTSPTEGGP